jgi:hypothetical protein
VERVLKGNITEGQIKPPFTREEAQAIFGQAGDRAKKWAQENPEYVKAADLLKPYLWACHVYDLPDRPDKK